MRETSVNEMMLKVYLGGPDVFLADADRVGRIKRKICREFGFEGLYPLDNDKDVRVDAARIFRANCRLLRQADLGLFNLTPFRGPSADAGTVFELGFLFASGKPVCGYSADESTYRARVEAFGNVVEGSGRPWDNDHAVEDFGLADNLMIVRAIEESGGFFNAVEEETSNSGNSPAAFAAFRSSVRRMQQQSFIAADADRGNRWERR
jgi:nucleoside 2-deoxyribosyltransferase